MATAIHHGPPGSYKSFTLVQRFAVPALKQGRAIVTNIRGFSDVQRVIDQFPDVDFPESARIIWVDTTTQNGRRFMAQWFHWVPFGAMIIIDEVQQVYPDRRDFKLESLDKFIPPPGLQIEDIGLPEGRPEDVFTAYDKQRHYNWDIYLSTPNIAKVKKEIREVSEWAYRHRNLSDLIPWKKNTWIEHQHDPESNGKSASHTVGQPTEYKADPRIFACYDSTATGQHTKSVAGRSILQDRKLQSLAVVIACCIGWFIYSAQNVAFVKAATKKDSPVDGKTTVPLPHHDNDTPSAVVSHEVDSVKPVLKRLDYLDRDHSLRWSINGIRLDEIEQLPVSCHITHSAVKCSFVHDPQLLRAASNYICQPSGPVSMCTVIFTVNRPAPKSVVDDKKTVLAKAMPF